VSEASGAGTVPGTGPTPSAEPAWGRRRAPRTGARRPWAKLAGAAALLAAALAVSGIGQPSARDRWERLAPEKEALLRDRMVQVHPGEVAALSQDRQVNLVLLDVRSEAEFNVFHLIDARRVSFDEIEGGRFAVRTDAPRENTVLVVMSNGEERATEAWKLLVAQGVPNVYVLDGGINRWLDVFGHDGHDRCVLGAHPGESLRHAFDAARGADQAGADPDAYAAVALEYTPKVKLEVGRKLGGGCG
jgi:rhodanese-related sulfurtransferase